MMTAFEYFSLFLLILIFILLPIFLILKGIEKTAKFVQNNKMLSRQAKLKFEGLTTCKKCHHRDFRITKQSQRSISSVTYGKYYAGGEAEEGYYQTHSTTDKYILYCKVCGSRIDEDNFLFTTSNEQSAQWCDYAWESGILNLPTTESEFETRWMAENQSKSTGGGGYIIGGILLFIMGVCMYYLFSIGIL